MLFFLVGLLSPLSCCPSSRTLLLLLLLLILIAIAIAISLLECFRLFSARRCASLLVCNRVYFGLLSVSATALRATTHSIRMSPLSNRFVCLCFSLSLLRRIFDQPTVGATATAKRLSSAKAASSMYFAMPLNQLAFAHHLSLSSVFCHSVTLAV
jgi:hypothetical protein